MILNPQMESIWGTLQGDYLIKRMISNDPRIRPSMSICGKRNYKWKLIIRKKAKIAYFDILAIFKKIYIFIFKCYLVSLTRWKIKTWRDCKKCQNDIGTWLSWLGVEIWRIRCVGGPWVDREKSFMTFWSLFMIKWQNWILHITFTWQ